MTDEVDIVSLGAFEVPDAQRVLDALEQSEIPFEAEPQNQPGQNTFRGSFGQNSRIEIRVRQTDSQAAQDILKKVLRIEL